jgi:hypothetical protein
MNTSLAITPSDAAKNNYAIVPVDIKNMQLATSDWLRSMESRLVAWDFGSILQKNTGEWPRMAFGTSL